MIFRSDTRTFFFKSAVKKTRIWTLFLFVLFIFDFYIFSRTPVFFLFCILLFTPFFPSMYYFALLDTPKKSYCFVASLYERKEIIINVEVDGKNKRHLISKFVEILMCIFVERPKKSGVLGSNGWNRIT